VIYLLPSGSRQLWSQDEARMALVAADALRHGGRLPAQVRDQPYLNKPPLFFWSVALVAWPRGHVSDRDAPIPSVASALAMLLGVFALGRRLSGAHTGFVAMIVLATAPGFFLHGHEILPDMMFAAWLTWALYFLLGALGKTPPKLTDLIGFYLCVAGALWTKGLPALMVIPATVAATLVSEGLRHLLRLRPAAGCALVTLAALPWAIPYAWTPGAERSQAVGAASSPRSRRCARIRSISSGSSMLAITFKWPPQRAQCSISIPNTRFKRRAQFSRISFGVGDSAGATAHFDDPGPFPPGVIAARSAAFAPNTP